MELLFNLYKIHSMSGQECAMRKFIKRYVRENIPGVVCVQRDKNLYFVKGEAESYPCVVAHLDQVQTKHSPDFRVFEHEGVLFGYSGKNKRQEGLGADDKNGIWVALKCLEAFESIKVAFFREEEIGCCGSSDADMSFFKDVRFVLEADRRNAGDLITDICGAICSTEFFEDISSIAEAHGYKETSGLMTDVETLSDNGLGVSAINFSCGYYNPHTDTECTVIAELENCLDFAMSIIATCTKVYPFKRSKSYYSGWGWGSKSKSKGWWSIDDEEEVREYNKSFGVSYDGKKEDGNHYDDVVTVNFHDYGNPYDAVFDFCVENAHLSQYDLWYYIQADCDTYGISYGDFVDIYWQALDYLTEVEDETLEEKF